MSRLNTKSRIELAHLKRQLELRVQPPWKNAHLSKDSPVFPSSVTKGTLTASRNLLSTPNTTATNKNPISPDTTATTPTATTNNKQINANANVNLNNGNKSWNSNATSARSRFGSGAGSGSTSVPLPVPAGENETESSLQPQSLLSAVTNNISSNNNANANANTNEASRPSKFDYKFVFTNTAMRKEDRIFRVKNPGVAIEKDMRIVKPLMATTSFLPYGVTIRNPHMFEEDQLAVIQRRQQVHNITYPTPQYNPFMTVRRERGSKTKLVNSNRNSSRREGTTTTTTPSPALSSASPANVSAPTSGSALVSKSPSQNTGNTGPNAKGSTISRMNSVIHTPIIPNRYSSGHAKANRRVRLANALQNKSTWGRGSSQLNSTALRDNQFRQQVQNLEKSTTPTVEENGCLSGESFLRNRHKQAVDNLSNTVQHLNRYEERLKHYLKSKNTMSHAAGALKQLWSLRSKKISQLSQLAVTLPDKSQSGNNTRQLLRSQPAFQNLSTLTNPNPTTEQKTTTYSFSNNSSNSNNQINSLDSNGKSIQTQEQTEQNNKQTSNGLPKHPQNYLADRKFIKSPLDTHKISKVIGKKNWSSIGERNKRNLSQRWNKERQSHINDMINSKNSMMINGAPDNNFKITPLQAAMLEGVDLDQISDMIGSPKPVHPNQSQQIGPMPVKTNNNTHNNTSRNNSPLNNTDTNTNDNNSSLLADKMKPTVSLYRYNDRDRDVKLLRPTNNKQRFSNLPLFNGSTMRENNLSPFNLGSERSSQHNWGVGGIESRRESQIFRRLYNEYHIHEDKIQNELKKEEWSGRKSREKKQSDQSSKRIVELNKQLNYRKVVKL